MVRLLAENTAIPDDDLSINNTRVIDGALLTSYELLALIYTKTIKIIDSLKVI